jgi:type I restriction-modification system DNA methylase subunit
MNNFREKANFIWCIADLLRGHYKQADYGKVILPFAVLRRMDIVLEPTKMQVLAAYEKHKDKKPEVLEPILNGISKVKFHNRSKFDFSELAKDHNNIAANLRNYINGYSIKAPVKLSITLALKIKLKSWMNMTSCILSSNILPMPGQSLRSLNPWKWGTFLRS